MTIATLKIDMPIHPNYIRSVIGGKEIMIDVADVTDENLLEIGEQWKQALIEHARERRKNNEQRKRGRR